MIYSPVVLVMIMSSHGDISVDIKIVPFVASKHICFTTVVDNVKATAN